MLYEVITVLQLAHVAGPGVGLQRIDIVVTERARLAPMIARGLIGIVGEQQRHVVAAVAQRRQVQLRHTQAVEQVV